MKTAFLFPGQGSQSVGMGGFLAEKYSIAQKTFREADEALGENLSELIRSGPEEMLKQTENAQPAILTVSVAAGRVLLESKLTPVVAAGHSLGEYSALVLLGALAFEDAVRLVKLRGRFMQEAVPAGTGAMSAILGAEDSLVEQVCKEVSAGGNIVEPANYNCPGQLVISGTVQGVASAVEMLTARGVKRCISLKVSAPFHCSLLKPAAEKLAIEIGKVQIKDPVVPYVANVDATLVTRADQVALRLIDQVYKPVRWTECLRLICTDFELDRVVEVGPGQVVSGHMKKIAPEVSRFASDSEEALRGALSAPSC